MSMYLCNDFYLYAVTLFVLITCCTSQCASLRKRLHVDVGEHDIMQDVDSVNAV